LHQHRVLFWGVLGALVMRAVFIIVGAALLGAFHWIIYLFGAFLLYTGVKMFRHQELQLHPEKNPALRLMRRWLPITAEHHGQRFFVRLDGRLWATPLFAVLVLVEMTDLVFAVDSIPAIFAVTRDPFIVFASNAFAILGLRALYFLLADIAGRFVYLKAGLSVILVLVGAKMLISDVYKVPVWASLPAIAAVLTVAVVASLLAGKEAVAEIGVPDPFGLLTDSDDEEPKTDSALEHR